MWYNGCQEMEGTAMKGTKTANKPAPRAARAPKRLRPGLDPAFYRSLAAFRRAVADGTVDVSKGCRNMAEYRGSLAHA